MSMMSVELLFWSLQTEKGLPNRRNGSEWNANEREREIKDTHDWWREARTVMGRWIESKSELSTFYGHVLPESRSYTLYRNTRCHLILAKRPIHYINGSAAWVLCQLLIEINFIFQQIASWGLWRILTGIVLVNYFYLLLISLRTHTMNANCLLQHECGRIFISIELENSLWARVMKSERERERWKWVWVAKHWQKLTHPYTFRYAWFLTLLVKMLGLLTKLSTLDNIILIDIVRRTTNTTRAHRRTEQSNEK